MKKHILLCLTAALTLLLYGADPVFADDTPSVIRVGYFQFSGYHVMDENGNLSGYGYDFLQKIGNYMDISYEYSGYESSYSDCLDMLEAGQLDLVTSVSKTPEREKKFLFSRKSIGTNSTIFTVKAGNEKVIAGDYSTYDGLTIGMLDGNSKNDNFAELATEKGFTYHPVYFETEEELTHALQEEEVDGIVSGSLRATKNEWMIEDFAAGDFYVAVRKDLPELMEKINDAIDQLDLDEPDWRSSLHRIHYALDTGGHIMLSAEERAYMQKLYASLTPLKVLVNPDRAPYSYFSDNEAKGVIPELFAELAQKLHLPYEYMEPKNRDEYYEMRRSGAADIVLDFAGDYFLAEQEGYKLTNPYLDTGFTRLTRRQAPDIIQTIAALRDSDVLNNYINTLYDQEQIRYYDTVSDCVAAVENKEADATILYTYTAERVLQRDVRNHFSFMIMGDSPLSYTIGSNASRGYLLRSILNQAIASMGESEISAIVMRETGNGLMEKSWSLVAFIYDNPVYGILIAWFFCLFLIVILLLLLHVRNQKILTQKVANVSRKYERQKLELREALSAAESASQSKSVFLFNMSHDIRTPMNAIIGFADIADKHIDDQETVKNAIHKIKISSDILLKLINDVLDLARIESGKTSLDLVPQNLMDCENSVYLLFREDMENADIEFSMESHIENPYVMCDYLRLNQISLNLLSNARKFTAKGGKVIYTLRQISPPDEQNFASYQISVKDNGIGMSKDFQKQVFDRFERERTSTVSGIQGTGLGLSIVKHIVEMMGGNITVESELGKGTEFIVTFRLQVVAKQDVINEDKQEIDRSTFVGKRLLLVEDNELNREIAVELLSEEGFLIEEADDGTVAVEKIAHSPGGFYDIVLMDIQMPVMDGYKATQEIRRLDDPLRARVPIIAMTANAFEEDRQRAFESGMDGHIGKPIDLGKLLELLQEVLNQK